MGAYVSVDWCRQNYDIDINCTLQHSDPKNTSSEVIQIGDVVRGEFEGNSDIAGIGIFSSFLAVTGFTMAISILDLLWIAAKAFKWKTRHPISAPERENKLLSVSDIFETIILSCSDSQIFTGAAYALVLRYSEGCSITAYHYNIVSNMMLLTTATHLMSVTMVRDYWKFPLLACGRMVCITGAFLVTGLLLSNANATGLEFPTAIPPLNETYSDILRLAACFQTESTKLALTIGNSFESEAAAKSAFLDSSPGNKIVGWNQYLILLLWYGVAIIGESVRYIRIGANRNMGGWRGRLVAFLKKRVLLGMTRRGWLSGLGMAIVSLYMVGGITVSSFTVVMSGLYMTYLRRWVSHSGWMKIEHGKNPENDATTFGQAVPIFLTGLILWSLLAMISEKISEKKELRRDRRRFRDVETSNVWADGEAAPQDSNELTNEKDQVLHETLSVQPNSGSSESGGVEPGNVLQASNNGNKDVIKSAPTTL